jgi:NAD+ kinase
LKNRSEIRRVGLVANTAKLAAAALLRSAAKLITRSGRKVLADSSSAEFAGLKIATSADTAALARACDVLLVFGGDGTMLKVARELAGARTPILGINIGGLGFLTAVSSSQLPAALRSVWAGEFALETRPLLEATATVAGRHLRALAFNDVVVSRGEQPRLVSLEVAVDGEVLTRYRCDGLILSSPTGSTAYSLAAGGAIVSPGAEVFTLTPICPHTLSNRSVIVSLRSKVSVRVASERSDVILAADGQTLSRLHEGDAVTIRRSKQSVRLVRLEGASFFQTLRRKLHWSGSHV